MKENKCLINPNNSTGVTESTFSYKHISIRDSSYEISRDAIAQDDQAMIEWEDLNFFVPANKPEDWDQKSTQAEDSLISNDESSTANGLPKENIIKKNNKYYKQILCESTGFVKPG